MTPGMTAMMSGMRMNAKPFIVRKELSKAWGPKCETELPMRTQWLHTARSKTIVVKREISSLFARELNLATPTRFRTQWREGWSWRLISMVGARAKLDARFRRPVTSKVVTFHEQFCSRRRRTAEGGSQSPIRAVADRLSARGQRPHFHLQLALCPAK